MKNGLKTTVVVLCLFATGFGSGATRIFDSGVSDMVREDDTIWVALKSKTVLKLDLSGEIIDSIVLIDEDRDNRLYDMVLDSSGTKWIATEGQGVFALSADTLINYTADDGLGFNCVITAAVRANDDKWFGTEGAGIAVFDGTGFHTVKVTDNSKEVVYSIKKSPDGLIWIATYTGVYAWADSVIKTITLPSYSYTSNSMLVDREGGVWIGTSGHGLYRYSDGILSDLGGPSTILSIHQDESGVVYCGAPMGGVRRYVDGTWEAGAGVSDEEVVALETGEEKDLGKRRSGHDAAKVFIGTETGVYTMDMAEFNPVSIGRWEIDHGVSRGPSNSARLRAQPGYDPAGRIIQRSGAIQNAAGVRILGATKRGKSKRVFHIHR